MRRLMMSRLIWIYVVCKSLLKSPLAVKGLRQVDGIFWGWGKTGVHVTQTWIRIAQLAFYVNLHRAVIGPSATLTGRWQPDIDLRRMLTGWVLLYSSICVHVSCNDSSDAGHGDFVPTARMCRQIWAFVVHIYYRVLFTDRAWSILHIFITVRFFG